MKHVAKVINLNQTSQGSTEHAWQQSGKNNSQPEKVINYLFLSLSFKYGHKWASLFPDDDTLTFGKNEWARELSSVAPERLRYGLDRCTRSFPEWPPTIGQFIALCEPDISESGLPSLSEAWLQICSENTPFSHGVVLAMRRDGRCNSYNWRLLPEQQGHKLFKPIYDEYISRAIGGEEFKLPIMVEDKVNDPVTGEERKKSAAKHLDAIKALLK